METTPAPRSGTAAPPGGRPARRGRAVRRRVTGSRSDATLLKTTALSALAIVVGTELHLFQAILRTTSLSLSQWGICLGVAFSIVVVAEACKLILRRRPEVEPRSAPAHESR